MFWKGRGDLGQPKNTTLFPSPMNEPAGLGLLVLFQGRERHWLDVAPPAHALISFLFLFIYLFIFLSVYSPFQTPAGQQVDLRTCSVHGCCARLCAPGVSTIPAPSQHHPSTSTRCAPCWLLPHVPLEQPLEVFGSSPSQEIPHPLPRRSLFPPQTPSLLSSALLDAGALCTHLFCL